MGESRQGILSRTLVPNKVLIVRQVNFFGLGISAPPLRKIESGNAKTLRITLDTQRLGRLPKVGLGLGLGLLTQTSIYIHNAEYIELPVTHSLKSIFDSILQQLCRYYVSLLLIIYLAFKFVDFFSE